MGDSQATADATAAAPAAPAAATSAPAHAPSSAGLGYGAPERTVYAASFGRTVSFSAVFLILLPFFVSLGPMIFARFKHGLLLDNWGLLVLAAAFCALMFLVFVELMFSLRARVELWPDRVKMTLPSGRGPTPMLRYRSHEIPYDQVHAVETRREVYGGALVPVLLKGARIELKDGSIVPLGYVSEANVDPAFPYPTIAKQIADRARLPLIDRGNVRRSMRAKMMGIRSVPATGTEEFVTEAQIAALNASHRSFVLGLISVLVVLMAIGIVDDLSEERLASAAREAPAASAPAPAAPAKPR